MVLMKCGRKALVNWKGETMRQRADGDKRTEQ